MIEVVLAGFVALTDPDVQPESVSTTICRPKYAHERRAGFSYLDAIRKRLLRERGIGVQQYPDWQIDYLISPTIGGSARNPENMLVTNMPDGGLKGALEMHLRCLICSGQVYLRDAQDEIYRDWLVAFQKYRHLTCTPTLGGP